MPGLIDLLSQNPYITETNPYILVASAALAIFIIIFTLRFLNSKPPATPTPEPKKKEKEQEQVSKKDKKAQSVKKELVVDHPLWITAIYNQHNITGFCWDGANILAFSSGSKILLFDLHTPQSKPFSIKLKNDATLLSLSNKKQLLAYLSYDDAFFLFDINAGDDKSPITATFVTSFPKNSAQQHKKDVISLQISNDGRFAVSTTDETIVKVWATGGDLLGEFNTNQMLNKSVCISPNSRFIAVPAFTSEARLWEVAFDKTGTFQHITKAMDLAGQKSAVNCVSFTSDSSHIFVGGKDGTWRDFNINVRYSVGATPILEKSGTRSGPITKMAVSPDGSLLAIIDKSKVEIWKLLPFCELDIAKIIPGSGEISWFIWSSDSKSFATVFDNAIHFWKRPE